MELSKTHIKYLITVRELAGDKDIRSVNVADKLSVSKPSVHRIIEQLVDIRLLDKKKNSALKMTQTGMDAIEEHYKSYKLLYRFFNESMKMDSESAFNSAITLVLSQDNTIIDKLCSEIDLQKQSSL